MPVQSAGNAVDWLWVSSHVGTPLGLLGLIACLMLFAWSLKMRNQERKLKLLPEHERAKAVDALLTRYGIDGRAMSPDQRFILIQRELDTRAATSRLYAILSALVFVACFAMASWAYAQSDVVDPPRPKSDEDLVWESREQADELIDKFNEANNFDSNGTLINARNLDGVLDNAIVSRLTQIPDSSLSAIYTVMKNEAIAQSHALKIDCIVVGVMNSSHSVLDFSGHEAELLDAADDGLRAVDRALSVLNAPNDDSVRKRGKALLSDAKLVESLGFYKAEFLATKVIVGNSDGRAALDEHLQKEKSAHRLYWKDNRENESPVIRIVLNSEIGSQ